MHLLHFWLNLISSESLYYKNLSKWIKNYPNWMQKSLLILLNLILKAFMNPKYVLSTFSEKKKLKESKLSCRQRLCFWFFFRIITFNFILPPAKFHPENFSQNWKKQFSEQNSNINNSVFERFFFFAKFFSQIFGPFKLFANLLGKRKVFFSFIFILNDAN